MTSIASSDELKPAALQRGPAQLDGPGSSPRRRVRWGAGFIYNLWVNARGRAAQDAGSAKVFTTLVMDRSHSMTRFPGVPLRAINSYLQQLAGSEARKAIEVSVVVFDHAMDILLPMQPVSRVTSLTQYPHGNGTRLHGTVADVLERSVMRVLDAQSRGQTVTGSVAVFTDGEDTSMPAGKHLPRLRRAVIEASDLGFQLISVGIGIDGQALAQQLWFPPGLAQTVDPDGVEILKAAADVSQMVEDFSIGFTHDQLPKVRE